MPDKSKAKKKSAPGARTAARGNGRTKAPAAKKQAGASKSNGSRGSRAATAAGAPGAMRPIASANRTDPLHRPIATEEQRGPGKRSPAKGSTPLVPPQGVPGAPAGNQGRPKPLAAARKEFLSHMLMTKRQEIMKEIVGVMGQRLTEDQQRRLESAMDVGDQALMDLERELGISLMEMRNRKRQLIDEALTRVADGTYGVCADCGVEISAKRLEAVPFAKLCVECQARQELLEKIEKEEERD